VIFDELLRHRNYSLKPFITYFHSGNKSIDHHISTLELMTLLYRLILGPLSKEIDAQMFNVPTKL
jgi:hypothetical protein